MSYPVASSQYYDNAAPPSPAYSGTFIPSIWSGKLLRKFYDATVLSAIANTDYEGEIKNQGDKVIIRTRPSIAISDYQAGMELAVQRPASNVIELLIDKGKYWNAIVDDVMEIQSDIALLNEWAEDASEQLKIAIDSDVLGNISPDVDASNQGNTAGRVSGSINLGAVGGVPGDGTNAVRLVAANPGAGERSAVDFIVDLNQALDEQNIPETGRWAIIPAWVAKLIKTGELKDASLSGDSTSILRNGRIGMIDRTTLYISNLLPRNNAEWTIFAGHSHGLTFASQIVKTETLRAERTFGTLMRGLNVYGYKVIDGTAIAMGIVKQ